MRIALSPAVLALAAAVLTVAPAVAPAETYMSEGAEYRLQCNQHGFVLRSGAPVTRAGRREVETVYLGRSCDAYHPRLGEGKWCWADGGFIADFPTASVGFPGQELACPADPELGRSCRC